MFFENQGKLYIKHEQQAPQRLDSTLWCLLFVRKRMLRNDADLSLAEWGIIFRDIRSIQ